MQAHGVVPRQAHSTGVDDVGLLLGPKVQEKMPTLFAQVRGDVELHDGHVRAAWERLGSPGMTPLGGWGELRRERAIGTDGLHDAATAAQRAQRDRHMVAVDLGTQVRLPGRPLDRDTWAVVGIGPSDRVHLARTDSAGLVERTQRRWPEMVLANPSLGKHHRILPVPDGDIAVELLKKTLPADVADVLAHTVPERLHEYQSVVRVPGSRHAIVLGEGPWEQVATRHGLQRMRPVARFPTFAEDAGGLVLASGTPVTQVTLGMEAADAFLGRTLLLGHGTLPASHRAAGDLREIERVGTWFDQRLGLPTMHGPEQTLLLETGSVASIANASATADAEVASLLTGPKDRAVIEEAVRHVGTAGASQALERDAILRRNWSGVLGHEVGHMATMQLWGTASEILDAGATDLPADQVARLTEHGVVEEAFSDLFGAAWMSPRKYRIRDLGSLPQGAADLDQLRAGFAAVKSPDTHHGTQLITKPMLRVVKLHGWDAAAEITAGATKSIGTQIGQGTIDLVDIPTAARALRDAAAMRYGATSSTVRGLEKAWTKLRVFTPG